MKDINKKSLSNDIKGKYYYKETANKVILAKGKKTFSINKSDDENQDQKYNNVLAYITRYERVNTLSENDIKNINLFMNNAKHIPKLDIKELIRVSTQRKNINPAMELGSNTEVKVPIKETKSTLNLERLKKCYNCGNDKYLVKRQTWGYTINTFTFAGKEVDVINELEYETLRRVYCSKCNTCIGTINKNIFMDINTHELFIKSV